MTGLDKNHIVTVVGDSDDKRIRINKKARISGFNEWAGLEYAQPNRVRPIIGMANGGRVSLQQMRNGDEYNFNEGLRQKQ